MEPEDIGDTNTVHELLLLAGAVTMLNVGLTAITVRNTVRWLKKLFAL